MVIINSRWHHNLRKKILWINFPLLSHIIPDAVGELVNYTLLEEYVIELKLLEHEAEIKRALFKKKIYTNAERLSLHSAPNTLKLEN